MRHSVRYVVMSTLLATLVGAAADRPADARDKDRDSYKNAGKLIGLWEGVDELDGSDIQISIADYDGDKTLDFRYRESFFTSCLSDSNTQGRGVAVGTVNIISWKKFELVSTRYVCFNDDNVGQIERDPFVLSGRFLKTGDIIKVGGNDTFPPLILHRTSSSGGDHDRD